MSNRTTDFLATTHANGWHQQPLAGDASSRRYVRLTSAKGQTSILMDAPKATPENMQKFAVIAEALRDVGLSAPEVYALNAASGLMLLEDLGATDIAKAVVQAPNQATQCYNVATDVLLEIQRVKPLELPSLTAENAALWLAPLAEWYDTEPRNISDIQAALIDAFGALGMTPTKLALRDYHAENLMWRPQLAGLAQIGLLDFQDAFYAPEGYDLASLTRDARRDVDPGMSLTLTEKMAKAVSIPLVDYAAQIAVLAVQRNLRILGIFASLSKRDGKTPYATLVPRVWTYLDRDLSHPALTKLRKAVITAIPAPTKNHLARWKT